MEQEIDKIKAALGDKPYMINMLSNRNAELEMQLAKLLGRVLGLFLMVHGGMGVKDQVKDRKVTLSFGLLLCAGTALLGLVLVLLPMSISRLLFSLIGVVMIALGVGDLYDRLNRREQLEAGDPDIIDVEKL